MASSSLPATARRSHSFSVSIVDCMVGLPFGVGRGLANVDQAHTVAPKKVFQNAAQAHLVRRATGLRFDDEAVARAVGHRSLLGAFVAFFLVCTA